MYIYFLLQQTSLGVRYNYFLISLARYKGGKLCIIKKTLLTYYITVEPRYNEVLGTMKITLLYQVSHYIRVKKQRNIKSWDQQNYLVIRGFCYIRPLYNEVPFMLCVGVCVCVGVF